MKIDDILKKCIEIPGISIKSSETSTELLFKSASGKGSMTFYSLFPGFNLAYVFVNSPIWPAPDFHENGAPMQQDLFYSIIVLQDAVKLSLITETMFILKTIICLSRNILLRVNISMKLSLITETMFILKTMICLSRNILLRINISIPDIFMKGWNFLLILQRSQPKTHGCCGNLGLTFIRLQSITVRKKAPTYPRPLQKQKLFQKNFGSFLIYQTLLLSPR